MFMRFSYHFDVTLFFLFYRVFVEMVRLKYRYIAFNIKIANRHMEITHAEFLNQLLQQVKALHGEHGFGMVSRYLKLVYWNTQTDLLVLRASRVSHRLLVTTAVLLSEINGTRVSLSPIRISGTLRCTAKFLRCYILRLPEVIERDVILKEVNEALHQEERFDTSE